MYTLYGQNFIAMIKSFYPEAKVASGGREIVVRCRACGDSSNSRHAHLYISVPQSADEVALYQCKKCSNHGIVDDIFLRQYGCEDSRILIDIVSHNNELKKNPKYSILRSMSIYPLRNTFISNQPWNTMKLSYINSRIGSNFAFEDLSKLKIFLNLYDVLNQNRLVTTRHKTVTDALNEQNVTWFYQQQALRDSAITSIKRPIGGGWGFGGETSTAIEACALALWGARNSKRDPNREMRIG